MSFDVGVGMTCMRCGCWHDMHEMWAVGMTCMRCGCWHDMHEMRADCMAVANVELCVVLCV